MSKFTQEELEILNQYVIDPEFNVFAVKGLAGIIKSRADYCYS